MKQLLVCVVLLTLGVRNSTALIGYDCETPELNVTAIAINEVATCSEEKSDYETKSIMVHVMQREDVKTHFVQTCLVAVVRTIMHCGMFSHTSFVSGGLVSYIHPLGAAECREVHRYKSMNYFNTHVGKLGINGSTMASVVMYGKLGANGACEGVTFTENDRTWEDVVVQAALKISLTEGVASVKLDTNEIILKGGVVCPFLPGYCMDTMYGETVWENSGQGYCKDVTTLYEGPAEKILDKTRRISYLVVEREDRIFALTLVGEESLCQRDGWQTEHPRIVVIDTTRGKIDGVDQGVLPQNTDLMAYVNSKLLYVEQAYTRQLEKLYIDTIFRRCQMHREILKNRLLSAPTSPSTVGWIIKQERGYIGRVLGEVLYLMKCTPRPAVLRRTERCYNELPVSVNNQSKFLSPVTHIILSHAEEIDCSPLIPPMFFLNNQWVGLVPKPVVKEAPAILQPEGERRVAFSPIQPLAGGGIYTNAEVTRSQKLIMFGAERKAVENILVRRISGSQTDNQGLQAVRLFDEEELKKLAQSTMYQLWGWFTDLGMFVSGLLGVYVIFQLLKYLLSVALNSWQIYRTLGCGIAIVAAIWDTLTMWVLHRHLFPTRPANGPEHGTPQESEMKEVLVTTAPSPTRSTAPDYNEVVQGVNPRYSYPPLYSLDR